ncbi:MAG: ATP-binding cassette domain-containing protein [Gammaproteobacteria bacterium]|nr:ATP-binding cassette domain-containing protein [Gammaproteobacteria bacterium]
MKNTLLTLQNISLNLPNASAPILSDIHYEVKQGDFILILGSNGSGKTSLLKLISRQYQPTRGTIYLRNENIHRISQTNFTKKISLLTQNSHDSLFTALTVYENYVLFAKKNISRDAFEKHLLDFNSKLSERLDQRVDTLSGGEKQALALALTLLNPPDILLLDEHTSALDPLTSAHIMSLTAAMAKKYDITCLLTTHNMEMAKQYGNRILALKHGKIYRMIEDRAHSTTEDLVSVCF